MVIGGKTEESGWRHLGEYGVIISKMPQYSELS